MTLEKNFPGGGGELRTYKSGKSYKKLLPEERKIGVRRPDDPRAVRYYGNWYLPIDVLPDEKRRMPFTRPDSDAYDHMSTNLLCHCDVCIRPQAEKWRRKWRREQGLQG